MKVIAWYKENGKDITRIFSCVSTASNCLKISKKRIRICIETGTSWRGILFDYEQE